MATTLTSAQAPFGVGSTSNRHQLGVGAGLEPELITSLGYTYRFSQFTNRLQVRVGAGITLPPYRLGSGSGRVNGLVVFDWKPSKQRSAARWGGRFVLLPYYARNQNEAGAMNGLGLEIRLMPLHWGDRWTSGPDLGWQETLLTYVRHSARVRATFQERYPGAEEGNFLQPTDGWYKNTAHRFRLGYTVSRRLGRSVGWQCSVGTLLSIQRQGLLLSFAHGQVPFYVETAFSISW